jgi:hypothetical protein
MKTEKNHKRWGLWEERIEDSILKPLREDFQHALTGALEGGQVLFRDQPNSFSINSKIGMPQSVTQIVDVLPGFMSRQFPIGVQEMLHSFAYLQEVKGHGIDQRVIV